MGRSRRRQGRVHHFAGRCHAGKLGHVGNPDQQRWRELGAAAEDYPVEAWDKVFNLNIRGLFLLTQQIAKRSMIGRRQRSHHQHCLDRGSARQPARRHEVIAYNTTKGALVNFTRTLAGEWGAYDITCRQCIGSRILSDQDVEGPHRKRQCGIR
ncbi:SDR family NAD(P)-dependent oxidoreductase [Dokdonella sp.]|uniref:SDR family NAD(P)-dependent oxidoreductase n=1 Tax=Dokdonella sp. TaxID=2291710 RepID=UPI00352867A0